MLGLLLSTSLAAPAPQTLQTKKNLPSQVPIAVKPECAQGAICFDGEVREGEEFRRALNDDLEFVLRLPGGIDFISRHSEGSCSLSSWIANPPFMAHHPTEIDAAYDWMAEDEVQDSMREFKIVENCGRFQSLYDLVYFPTKSDPQKYFELLRGTPGSGRLWITGSRVSHHHDGGSDGHGAIEWLKFVVEIRLPDAN